ncbi:MAG: hypothetical protein ACRDHG_14380, partial [Anaerolineales bacterium]
VKVSLGLRAALVSTTLALALALLSWVLVRNWERAAVLATGGLFLFYSYGHIYNALHALDPGLGRHRYLVPVFGLFALGLYWWVRRTASLNMLLTPLLNGGLALALAVPLIRMFFFRGFALEQAVGIEGLQGTQLSYSGEWPPPDVYFLLLDAYTRADTLIETYDFDNHEFIETLESLGFYVAECAQSNYSQTELSLSATLNATYLDDLIDPSLQGGQDRAQLWPWLRHNQVRMLLEQLGYSTVAVETGYYWSEWEDADDYRAPQQGWLAGMSAFEATLLRSTAAWAAIDALPVLPAFLGRDLDRSTEAHRERVSFVLDTLEQIPREPGPKFVFIHLVSPHRPFVFDAAGNPVEDDYTWQLSSLGVESYKQGYREQIAYLNGRIENIVRTMISESAVPPVIVLQGDHGPEEGSSQDRMRILNAMYLAGHGPDGLYPAITSVNTFRVIFNTLFEAGLPLLPDASYFSDYQNPFDYTSVPAECPN